jgi:uncharacterized membrane protein (DUF4010 family)
MTTNDSSLFLRFGISLAVGILVGIQREFASEPHTKELAAGVRTFGLLGLVGCSAALLSDLLHSPLPLVCVIIAMAAFFSINYYIDAAAGKPGLTTKASMVLTLCAGALAYWQQTTTLAVALAVTTAVLLSIKIPLHRFVKHLTHEDVSASLKLAVITAIVLPILPNRPFGSPPFDIFNPLKLWLFVVFISGISFVGYVLIKVAGAKKGIGLTGLLGGMASSTAVTLSFTAKSRERQDLSKPFALAITVAWTVMFVRVLAVVAVLNIALVKPILLPIAGSIAAGLLCCAFLYRAGKTDHRHDVAFANPFELGLAIKFGLLFALILLFSRATQVYFGDNGVYASSFLSGMADVDAIAFSMARLSRGIGGIDPLIASRAIVLAAVANTLVKGCIVLFTGAPALKRAILPGFILIMVVGVALSFLVK